MEIVFEEKERGEWEREMGGSWRHVPTQVSVSSASDWKIQCIFPVL